VDAYTRRNVKTEVEDLAPKFGMSPKVDYRVARDALGTEQTAISYLRLAPNHRLPFGHRHKQQEEIYVLVTGTAHLKLTTRCSISCRGTPSASPRRRCAASKPTLTAPN
jgi:uncharacterized cupin superfamily protein